MNTPVSEALLLTIVMAAAIFFCRVFPFLFFRGKSGNMTHNGAAAPRSKRITAFLAFVEKTVPPVAMAVLAFNALSSPVKANPRELLPVLSAAIFTALIHLWKRNPLISIFGGTALYMVLIRVLG